MLEDIPMDQFIQRANIQHYRHLLSQTTDGSERARIQELLAEEEAKEPKQQKSKPLRARSSTHPKVA